jgi:8-oxo-dGTP diphosphatase
MTSSADPAALPQCAVAVDLVVLTVREGQLCVLTVRRGIPPFRGRFALPGGFVLPDEGLEAAAYRELAEEAGLARGGGHLGAAADVRGAPA